MADYTKTPVLSKIKIGTQTYYLKDEDARALLNTIAADYLKGADKTELLGKIAEKVAISDYNTKMAALDAKDAEIAANLQDEIDARVEDVADLQEQIDAIEAGLVKVKSGEKILGLDGTTKELSTVLDISIEKFENKDYIYLRGISGVEVAKVDASAFVKDGMIENVELVKKDGKIYLKITFNTESGKQPIELDVSELIDIYTAGNGLQLDGKAFSAKIDAFGKYLSASSAGLKVDGGAIASDIAAAVADEAADREAADEALGDDIAEVAGDLAEEITRATGVEGGLDTRLTTAEGEIDALQADSHTHSNKTVLDGITAAKVTAWDGEVGAKAAVAAEETRAKAAEALKEDKANLGDFAYANEGTGTVAGQTITGVKATGDVAGAVTVDLGYDTTNIASTGSISVDKYALADAANATAATVASTEVTASKVLTAGTVATFTEGTFTPNTPTVIDISKFNGGSAATYSHTGFSGGSLADATKSSFVKKALKYIVDDASELLTLDYVATTDTEFYGQAVSEQGTYTAAVYGTDTFNGGSAASLGEGFYTAGTAASKANDTFNGGAMPTFEDAVATNVTGVTYKKQVLNATPTTVNINVSGNYDKAKANSASIDIKNVEFDVGDIEVTAKDVTVTPKA